MDNDDTRRRYTYRGHYVSRLSPEYRPTQDDDYRPRRERHSRGLRALLARAMVRKESRHARPGDTILVTARRSLDRLGARLRAMFSGDRLVGRLRSAFRPTALKTAWRRATPYLGATLGILIVILSVYLVRQGTLVPQEPVTWGEATDTTPVEAGADPVTEPVTEPGAEPVTEPGAGTGTGGGIDSVTDSATDAVTGAGPEPRSDASNTGVGSAADGDPDQSQMVIEDEGPTAWPLGPMSLEQCLAGLEPPVGQAQVIQGMGWCYVEVLDAWRYHSGIDIALTDGQAVRAALDGLVTRVGRSDPEAWVVVISHGFGLETIYAHLGAVQVSEGDQVRTGHIIGWGGEPGILEAGQGIHLHFQMRVDGDSIDPTPYIG